MVVDESPVALDLLPWGPATYEERRASRVRAQALLAHTNMRFNHALRDGDMRDGWTGAFFFDSWPLLTCSADSCDISDVAAELGRLEYELLTMSAVPRPLVWTFWSAKLSLKGVPRAFWVGERTQQGYHEVVRGRVLKYQTLGEAPSSTVLKASWQSDLVRRCDPVENAQIKRLRGQHQFALRITEGRAPLLMMLALAESCPCLPNDVLAMIGRAAFDIPVATGKGFLEDHLLIETTSCD